VIMKAKEYCILENRSTEDLAIEVVSHLQDGWELQGGPVASMDADGDPFFIQALFKQHDSEPISETSSTRWIREGNRIVDMANKNEFYVSGHQDIHRLVAYLNEVCP